MEEKGLKMNTGKTKVIFSCSMKDKVKKKGKWPCGVCKKGVGSNSNMCHSCKKWIYDVVEWKEVCVMQASRSSADAVRPITDGLNTYLHLDIGNGVSSSSFISGNLAHTHNTHQNTSCTQKHKKAHKTYKKILKKRR